jgi:glucokinase
LRDVIAKQFDATVIVDNDANAQAYGELCFGVGNRYSDIIFVTLSTGIGSGLIIDNHLIRGKTGTAGEIGHTIIDSHSDIQCSCGNYGCLMSLSSGIYLPQLYKKYLNQGIPSSLGLTLETVSCFDGIALKKGLDLGDKISEKVLHDSAFAVGTGLYNLFQILNPEVFIIGGGLINIGDIYLDLIKKRFFSLVKDMLFDTIDFIYPSLGDDAGLLGAAALILEQK